MGETSVLVIYQHLPRVHRKRLLYGIADRLIEHLQGEKLKCPMPVSISDNQIAFIILAKDSERQAAVREAVNEYTRSHLEVYD